MSIPDDLLAKYREAYWAEQRRAMLAHVEWENRRHSDENSPDDDSPEEQERWNKAMEMHSTACRVELELLEAARGEVPEDLQKLYEEYGDE